jgi:ribose 5-phosphate isomerase A
VLPVEVLPFLWRTTAERLAALGTSLTVRGGEEAPYITDNGNLILDLLIEGGIVDSISLAHTIRNTIGVVEHGLFIGMTDTCIVAGPDGPEVLGRPPVKMAAHPPARKLR